MTSVRVQILLLLSCQVLARLPIMAESTKELTDEGAKVTTTVEGSDATAAAPAEPGKKGYWPGAVWNSTGRDDGTRGQI